MMWADAVETLNVAVLDTFQDSDVTLTRGASAYTCRAIYRAPHDSMTPTGDGSVSVTSFSPSLEINESDLDVRPVVDDRVAVVRDLAGGGHSASQTYRVVDVQQDGNGVLHLSLLEIVEDDE